MSGAGGQAGLRAYFSALMLAWRSASVAYAQTVVTKGLAAVGVRGLPDTSGGSLCPLSAARPPLLGTEWAAAVLLSSAEAPAAQQAAARGSQCCAAARDPRCYAQGGGYRCVHARFSVARVPWCPRAPLPAHRDGRARVRSAAFSAKLTGLAVARGIADSAAAAAVSHALHCFLV